MKARYLTIIILLIIIAVVYAYIILTSDTAIHPQLDHVLQGLGIFVALLASVFALSASNPRLKKISTEINFDIEDKKGSSYEKAELDDDIKVHFENYKDPITTHKIDFSLQNTSGFTLNKPTLTFRLPKDRRHPYLDEYGFLRVLSFNSNLYNNSLDFKTLEFLDSIIISNSNLPYWNNKDKITIWIRMAIASQPNFKIRISLNCDNAEGITKEIEIEPAKLLS